jgi:hypothetical protein
MPKLPKIKVVDPQIKYPRYAILASGHWSLEKVAQSTRPEAPAVVIY